MTVLCFLLTPKEIYAGILLEIGDDPDATSIEIHLAVRIFTQAIFSHSGTTASMDCLLPIPADARTSAQV